MPQNSAPVEDDIRYDDEEYNPNIEPKKSRAWLNLLQESENAFENWNIHCDNIDKQFASLERLSNMVRDKEFQMFWANCEVLKPSHLRESRPYRWSCRNSRTEGQSTKLLAEMMERCCIVAFDLTRINDLMLLVRDDLS